MRSPAWPGLVVTVRVDGNDLEEFEHDNTYTGEENHSESKMIRYVESKPDQQFEVIIDTDDTFQYWDNDLMCYVYVDGVKASFGNIMKVGNRHRQPRKTADGMYYTGEDGKGVFQPFLFSELETSDGAAASCKVDDLAELGQIRVEVMRIKVSGKPKPSRTVLSALRSDVVPEKALKGQSISNRAKLGTPTEATPVTTVRTKYPWGQDPFATFTFYYRSRRDLQIEGMIPRTPIPTPLEERDPDTLTHEEALEVVRRQRQQMEQTKVAIKREKSDRSSTIPRTDDDSEGDLTVVEEHSRAQKRARLSSPSMVVDLTDE